MNFAKMDGNRVGNNLKRILSRRNYSQKTLALKTGLTQSAISRYVNGSRLLTGENLEKVAEVLGVETKELVGK